MLSKYQLLFCLLYSVNLFGQQLTLKECVAIALEKHPDIALNELDYEYSATQILQAKSGYLPEISASIFQSGNFGRSIDRFTNSYIDQFYNTSYAGLGFRLPLFTSMRIKSQVASAKLNHEANEYKLARGKNTLTLAVITTYITALSNAEIIENARNQYRSDSINYQRLLEKKAVGLTTRIEELQLLNQLKTDEIAIDDAILNYNLALLELAQLMNTPIASNTSLKPIEPTNDSYFDQGADLEKMPEVQELKLKIAAQSENIKATRAQNFPLVQLSGDYGTFFASSNKERSFFQQLNDTRNGSVSLGFSIPIMGNLRSSSVIEGQRVQQKILKANLEKTMLKVQQERDNAYARYLTLRQKYQNANFLLELAKENRAAISEQLNAGLTTMVEFLIAQNNVEKAANTATQSKYQLVMQQMILRFYAQSGFSIE